MINEDSDRGPGGPCNAHWDCAGAYNDCDINAAEIAAARIKCTCKDCIAYAAKDEKIVSMEVENNRLERERGELRYELDNLTEKNTELTVQLDQLDSYYDTLRTESAEILDQLVEITRMYTELQAAAVEVLNRDLRYRTKIAKLKYKVLKAQIVNS